MSERGAGISRRGSRRGEVIGLSGNTGQYTIGAHVHMEMRECDLEVGSPVRLVIR